MNERLYRSRDDRIIAGVAGGLAEQFHVDPSLIRILWAILIIPTGGLALLLYVLMAFIVPEEPAGDARWAAWERSGGGYQWPDGGAAPTAAPTDAATAAPTPTPTTPTTMGFTDIPAPTAADPNPPGVPAPATAPPATGAGGSIAGLFPNGARAADPRASTREARRAAREERREWRREHRDPTSTLIFGLILILVGAFFFVRAYVPNIDLGDAWPVLLVIVGVVLLIGSFRRSSGTPT
jgi:phage shock protein C